MSPYDRFSLVLMFARFGGEVQLGFGCSESQFRRNVFLLPLAKREKRSFGIEPKILFAVIIPNSIISDFVLRNRTVSFYLRKNALHER